MASAQSLLTPSSEKPISIKSLQEVLRDLPTDGSESTIRNNFSLVQTAGEPANIISILKEVLDTPSLLTTVANKSYRHVNHFDKIVLIDSDNQDGYRLTLHLWSPPYTEQEINDELIHDHRFSFWSTLLTGDLVSENFSRASEGQIFRQYRYVPERSTLSNFYEFMGEMPLVRTAPQKNVAGETYYLYYESTHRVLLPRAGMTCTLVLRGPRVRPFSNVYNTTYPTQHTRISNTTFSEEQLSKKLQSLLETIESTRLRKPSMGNRDNTQGPI